MRPGLNGGDAEAVSEGFGDKANRGRLSGSFTGTLPVLLCPRIISFGAVSMLTLLLMAADVCCGNDGGEDTSEVRLGDVGDAALLLKVCAIGVDAALIGDAGRCDGPPNATLELLVGGREEPIREVEDTADPLAEWTMAGRKDISGAPLA